MDEACKYSLSEEESQIKNIISRDDKFKFVSFFENSLVKKSGDLVQLEFGEFEVFTKKVLAWICDYNAVHCATALVEGEMDLKVDLNAPMHQGAFPLHGAAYSLSVGLTKLFLRHGALTGVRCNTTEFMDYGSLPLDFALRRVSSDKHLIRWTPKQSTFKLIIILCLPKLREALETIKLLAWSTKEIKQVIRHHAKEGRVIALAILLMVAREKVMEPIEFQGGDYSSISGDVTIYECIISELARLIDEEFWFLGDEFMGDKESHKLVRSIVNKKVAMMSTLLLLEIFERAGDALEAYFQSEPHEEQKESVAKDVAKLLEEAGFVLKTADTSLSDTIDRDLKSYPAEPFSVLSSVPIKKQKDQSEDHTECGSQGEDVYMPLNSKPAIYQVQKEHERVIGTSFTRGSGSSFSAVHPPHSFRSSKCGLHTGLEVQRIERTRGTQQFVWNFPQSKRWATFALAVKRGIRFL